MNIFMRSLFSFCLSFFFLVASVWALPSRLEADFSVLAAAGKTAPEAMPAWVKALGVGGGALTSEKGWVFQGTGGESISFWLDRGLENRPVRLAVELGGCSGAQGLWALLMDAEMATVATVDALHLGLTEAGGALTVSVPLDEYPSATWLFLMPGDSVSGSLKSVSLYIDVDGDGLDADQEAALGTSDTNSDSDGDGFSDYDEWRLGSDPADALSVPQLAALPQDWVVREAMAPLPLAANFFLPATKPSALTGFGLDELGFSDAVKDLAGARRVLLRVVDGELKDPFAGIAGGLGSLAVADAAGMPFSQAVRFRSGRVHLGQPAGLNVSGAMTMAAWVKPGKRSGLQNIFSRGFVSSPQKRELVLRLSGTDYQFGYWNGSDHFAVGACPASDVGAWVHLAGVYDGEAYRLYRNGELLAECVSSTPPAVFDAPWTVGGHATASTRFFQGDLGEVAVWSTALSPEACRMLYAQGLAGHPAGALLAEGVRTWMVPETGLVLTQPLFAVDTTPPLPTLPGDCSVGLPADDFSTVLYGQAVATDAVTPSPYVFFLDAAQRRSPDGRALAGFDRVWSFVDEAGNTATASQRFTLTDTQPPTLTLPPDYTGETVLGSHPNTTGWPTVSDNADPDPVVAWEDLFDSAIQTDRVFAFSSELICSSVNGSLTLPEGSLAELDTSRPFTFSVWINPTAWADNRAIITKGIDPATKRGIFLRINNSAYQFGYFDGANALASYAMPVEDRLNWVHLAGRFTGSTFELYRNGVRVAEKAGSSAPFEAIWAFGRDHYANTRYYQGSLRHIGIWARALSPREIALLASPEAIEPTRRGVSPAFWRAAETVHDGSGAGALLPEGLDALNVAKPFTVAAWIKPETTAGNLVIAEKGYLNTASLKREVTLRIVNGTYQFGYWNGGNYFASFAVPSSDVGTWVHLAGRFVGNAFQLYRNGVLVASKTATPAHFSSPWGIGRPGEKAERYFAGELAALGIWPRALTPDEIAWLATSRDTEIPTEIAAPTEEDARTIIRQWTATDSFLNATTGTQTLTLTHAYRDEDQDGLCTWLEIDIYGTDPQNPDTDGDSLSDGDEVFLYATDPTNPDTDSDLLPDDWEIRYGFNPLKAGETYLDPDQDGLSNVAEYRAGTNPLLADTDGDGVSDGTEVLSARTNPLEPDFNGATLTPAGEAILGSAAAFFTGNWSLDGESIYARERAGSVTYTLTVPSPAPHALGVTLSQHNRLTGQNLFDITLSVDGLPITRLLTYAPFGSPAEALFFLPPLDPGTHTFRITWHNLEPNTFLAIHSLRFLTLEGSSDWLTNRNDSLSTLNPPPSTTYTSPLCVEGTDAWRDVLEIEINDGVETTTLPVIPAIGEGFYADIALPEDGTALELTLSDTRLTHTFAVAWEPFPLLEIAEEQAESEEPFVLRTGDALLFSGPAHITVSRANGENWVTLTNLIIETSAPYRFEAAGDYLLTAEAESGDPTYALISATASRFPLTEPAVTLGRTRSLAAPALDPAAELEHDADLTLSATPRPTGGLTLDLLATQDRPHGLLTRLPGGPILDAAQVRPIWGDNGEYYRVLETYADGSQLTEVVLQLGEIPPGLSVILEILVSGVSFADGTRKLTLTAADFDENGFYRIRLLRAANVKTSVCHTTTIYQNGTLLYTNKK